MKIWKLDCDVDNYENLMLEDMDLELLHSFDGRSIRDKWEPLNVKRMYNRKFSNTPGLASHIPIFDNIAVEVLKEYLDENVEILPLICDDKMFYAINVVNVQDCIDYSKSKYICFRDGTRIMRFMKYSFDEIKVQNVGHIFKLKDEPLKCPFVSDRFRETVIENKLQGFKFELAWDSDN